MDNHPEKKKPKLYHKDSIIKYNFCQTFESAGKDLLYNYTLRGPLIFLRPKLFNRFGQLVVKSNGKRKCTVLFGIVDEPLIQQKIILDVGREDYLLAEIMPFHFFSILSVKEDGGEGGEDFEVEIKFLIVHNLITSSLSLPQLEARCKSEFIENSFITIPDIDFNLFSQLTTKDGDFDWQDSINATEHWYQTSSSPCCLDWIHPEFVDWLQRLTNLELKYPKTRPTWKRFKPGSYVIMNDKFPQAPGLDLIYTLDCDNDDDDAVAPGDWIYLDEEGEEVLRIPGGRKCSLSLIYKTPLAERPQEAAIKRFKHYWPHTKSSAQHYVIQMLLTFPVVE